MLQLFFYFSDVEIAKLEKRRKRLRERSPSPIPYAGGKTGRPLSPLLPLPSVAPHLNRLPETHAKIMYMSAIGLARNTEEQKIVNEVIWSAILDDRLARGDPPSTINTYFVRLRDMAGSEMRAKGPCQGSLLPPPPPPLPSEAAKVGKAVPQIQAQLPSLNIPSVHCGVKEEVVSLHAVKLEAGMEAGGNSSSSADIKALSCNILAGVVKSEPEEQQLTLDLKRRLEEPAGGGQVSTPIKRKPQQQQQQQLVEVDGGGFVWPGIQAVELAYKKYKEGKCVARRMPFSTKNYIGTC